MFSCPECRLLARSWLIAMLITFFTIFWYPLPFPIVAMLLFLPVVASLRLAYSGAEIVSLLLPLLILWFFSVNSYAQIYCTASYVFMILSVRSGRRWGAAVSIFILAVLFAKAITFSQLSWADAIYLICATLTIILNIPLIFYKQAPLKSVRIIADSDVPIPDAVKIFTFSAIQEGATVICTDDAAGVLMALNQKYFKALHDIVKNISIKRGDKVFILYSSRFYIDAPYLLIWLALTLKGAKVMGRAHIGIGYEKFIEDAGGDFAAGFKCGLPPLVPVLPIFIIGLAD